MDSSSPPSSPTPGNSEFPPKKNDADCYNCAGVAVLSHEMRKLGLPPKCYGIEYKAGKAIPADVMTQLESLPVINADSRVYLIGLSQSSSRMRRMGQVPIVKFGIKVVLSHEQRSAKTNHNRQQQKKQMDEIDDKDDIVIEKITTKNIKERQSSQLPPKTSSLQPEEPNKQHENKDEAEPLATHGIVNKHKTEVTALDRFLARYNGKSIENFVIAYKASCSRLWGSMGRVFDRTTDNFPEKFYRSSVFLIGACERFSVKISDRIKKIVSSIGESNNNNK